MRASPYLTKNRCRRCRLWWPKFVRYCECGRLLRVGPRRKYAIPQDSGPRKR